MPEEVGIKIWQPQLQSMQAEGPMGPDVAASLIARDQQVDGRRELPCATGVIDLAAFLNALNQIGYDGPIRAEPFNQAVNKMSKDDACAAAAASLRKAFSLIT